MISDFRKIELPKWKRMINGLFNGNVPDYMEWSEINDIIKVLDYVGKHDADNHTFLPDGGGLDLIGCKESNEEGCLELLFGTSHIVKPKRLILQHFPICEYEWTYFRLETNQLAPSGVYQSITRDYEELVELSAGNYISRRHWDIDDYNGQPLPHEARLIARVLNGSFVTFSKASIYNQNSDTYDGRHNKMSTGDFKAYIQRNICE